MRTSFLKPLAVVAAVLVAPAAARADYLTGFTGNSVVSLPNDIPDGVINFSVFENKVGQNLLQSLGAATQSIDIYKGGGAQSNIDLNAKYVYMFQVVNTKESSAGSSADIIRLNIQVNPAMVTGFGVLNNQIFTEDTGGTVGPDANVGPSGNTRLDGLASDPVGGVNTTTTLTAMGGTAESLTKVGLTDDATNKAGLNGVTGILAPNPNPAQPGGTVMQYNMTLGTTNQYSSVLFFTSNTAPVFMSGATVSLDGEGVVYSVGMVPTPNPAPEPGTMALLAFGLPLAGVGYRRLRKRAAEAIPAV